MLPGVGPATLRNVSRVPGFENLKIDQVASEVPRLQAAMSDKAWSDALEKAEEQIYLAKRSECRILSQLDADYPKLLATTKDDPFIIWFRGTLSATPEYSVAIVGTREPTNHGKIITQRVTRFFVDQGWSIVSGLALGCDGIAHQEAVDAGGHTVAVLAHGLQTISPSNHRALSEDILNSGGALISQYPLGREAIPQQFVQRDKTQAGLAQGVVMIQSDLKGGSLHAARATLDYGRWLAVPYPTEQDRSRRESKVQANLLMSNGEPSEIQELLRLKLENTLDKIIILKSKDDYIRCLQASTIKTTARNSSQESIF